VIASTIDISLSDIIQTHALNGAQGAIAYDPAEHLTEMERVYVHRLTTPDLPLHCVTDHSPDADFDDVTPETAQADLRIFADHCTRSHQVIAALPLDANLRWTYT
jgi:hypothetical protein